MSKSGVDQEFWWKDFLQYSSKTDVGMRRTNNQDSFKSVPAPTQRLFNERGHLFIVADGMGAHAAGELASKIAVDTVSQNYLKKITEPPFDAIHHAVLEAHSAIKLQGRSEAAFKGMGTTCVALLILPEGAMVAHVGDSRVYRLRHGVMEQLTFDHSLLWELKRLGKLANSKDESSVPKNVITRSLGPTENLVVDLEGPYPCEEGDTFLLCSDGLSGQLHDDELAQIIGVLPPEEATSALINIANLRGGPDNITVTVVKISGTPNVESKESGFGIYKKRPPLSVHAQIALPIAITFTLLAVLLFFMKMTNHIGLGIGALTAASLLWGIFFFLARNFLIPEKEEKIIEPLGKGPYVRMRINLAVPFIEAVDGYRREAQAAIVKNSPKIDLALIDKMEKKIDHCREKEDLAGMLSMNLRAINYLFSYIKKNAIT